MSPEKLSSLKALNQLNLTQDEENNVLNFFNKLTSDEKMLLAFNTDNVKPMVHVLPIKNTLRDDVCEKLFSREALLKGAPQESDGYWQVPRLVE